mmetsp:Transcript_29806/g.62240  ORF Transcript_29806/g.62240 Transcript_29806/m.62240 type:complete len:88 (-) Transcript_29806:2529-2792(-)
MRQKCRGFLALGGVVTLLSRVTVLKPSRTYPPTAEEVTIDHARFRRTFDLVVLHTTTMAMPLIIIFATSFATQKAPSEYYLNPVHLR